MRSFDNFIRSLCSVVAKVEASGQEGHRFYSRQEQCITFMGGGVRDSKGEEKRGGGLLPLQDISNRGKGGEGERGRERGREREGEREKIGEKWR